MYVGNMDVDMDKDKGRGSAILFLPFFHPAGLVAPVAGMYHRAI